jgi:hypothetical protein
MNVRRHTIMAVLVIASFVALEAIRFLGNYYPGGVIRTESQAIAAARIACPFQSASFDGPWRAQLLGGFWYAHIEWTHGLFHERFDGAASAKLDARTGKRMECRTVSS